MSQHTFMATDSDSVAAAADKLNQGRTFGQHSLQRFMYVLTTYWFLFWFLNGLDKFFNYPHFFGVTRDQKFIKYFATLDLPPFVALVSLYAVGILEVLLGISFLVGLLLLHRTRKITLVNLELSLFIFLGFSIADILFGDRKELWEHGTYIVLIIISYLSTLLIARELPQNLKK